MLFKLDLINKIISGDKTQTRRPIKEGETLTTIDGLKTVLTPKGRIKWQVGRDYAVQYGRGKPMCWIYKVIGKNEYGLVPYDLYQKKRGHGDTDGDFYMKAWYPLRLKLLDIRQEDVRNITKQDAGDEGFPIHRPLIPFLEVWSGFYDRPALPIIRKAYGQTPYAHKILLQRPDNLYQAYALTFEIKDITE